MLSANTQPKKPFNADLLVESTELASRPSASCRENLVLPAGIPFEAATTFAPREKCLVDS